MADEKVFTNEVIEETPFPGGDVASVPTSERPPAGTFQNKVAKEKSFPTQRIAVELLSTSLNTKTKKIIKEFQFTPSGAIQIGDYKSGETGDLRLSPEGIVARNKAGLQTFALDGTTGDAVFKGTIQAGAVVTGTLAVGPDGDIYIDGENKRMIWYNDGIPSIVIGEVG